MTHSLPGLSDDKGSGFGACHDGHLENNDI